MSQWLLLLWCWWSLVKFFPAQDGDVATMMIFVSDHCCHGVDEICKVFPAQRWWYVSLERYFRRTPSRHVGTQSAARHSHLQLSEKFSSGRMKYISGSSSEEQKITHRGKSIRYKVDRDFLAEGGVHLRDLKDLKQIWTVMVRILMRRIKKMTRMISPDLKWSECYLGTDSRSRGPFAKLEGYLEPPIEVPWTYQVRFRNLTDGLINQIRF